MTDRVRGVRLIGTRAPGGIAGYMDMLRAAAPKAWPDADVEVIDSRGPRAWASPAFALSAALRLLAAAALGRIDVAHLMASERLSLWRKAALLAVARAAGLRAILHHHGAELGLGRGIGERAALRLCARLAHVHVVLGTEPAGVLRAAGADPSRIVTLPNALPAAPPTPRGPRDGPLRILFLAVMTPRKGALETVEAAARLKAMGVDAVLTLAGDGPAREAAEARAEALGLRAAGRVRFVGAVDAAGARTLMAEADVLAHPSSHEGLPLTLLEALRDGLPAVAAPVGAIGEALPDGDGVRHAPPREPEALAVALAGLAKDETARLALGRAGRARFEAVFTLDAHLDRLAGIYGWSASHDATPGLAPRPEAA